MFRATPVALAAALAAHLLAQVTTAQATTALQVDGADLGVRVTGEATWNGRGRSVQAELPSGSWNLTFAPVAGARADAITVEAPGGGAVRVAIGRASAGAEAQLLAASAATAGPFAFDGGPNVRLVARVRIQKGAGAIGIACRWQGENDHYRFVFDDAARELQLVRAMSGDVRTLRRAPAPVLASAAEYHELELEVEGFRMTAFCDGQEVMRCMDGGLDRGACATWAEAGSLDGAAAAGEPTFVDVRCSAPAVMVPTLCAITEDRTARVVASAKLAVDCPFALWLRLDRPTSLWITDDAGLEPFMLRAPSDPVFMPFAHGTVDRDGMLRGQLEWPLGSALQLQAVLIGGFLGTPDGSALRERLPWAQLRF